VSPKPTEPAGVGSFQNDDAGDWLDDLCVSDDASSLNFTLALEPARVHADVGLSAEVIAACESVAALLGRPAPELPAELTAWVRENTNLDAGRYRSRCITLLQSILEDGGALAMLWGERDLLAEWKREVEDVLQRIGR